MAWVSRSNSNLGENPGDDREDKDKCNGIFWFRILHIVAINVLFALFHHRDQFQQSKLISVNIHQNHLSSDELHQRDTLVHFYFIFYTLAKKKGSIMHMFGA